MEVILVSTLSIIVSALYLSFAPMHEIKGAIYHAENVANQDHKNAVRTTTK